MAQIGSLGKTLDDKKHANLPSMQKVRYMDCVYGMTGTLVILCNLENGSKKKLGLRQKKKRYKILQPFSRKT